MTHEFKKQPSRIAVIAAACAATLLAGEAAAQSAGTNSGEFNGGWGRIQGTENAGINVRTRDENGNRIIVDGMIQDGSENSEYVSTDAGGAGSVYSGAGGRRRWQGATAIGNNLQVITQGSWNTVIVNSNQVNNGNVTAKSSGKVINGEIDLND